MARKRLRRRTAAGARPPGGQSSALGALLVITLANLAFGCEPVFRFVARFESAALRQQIGQPADFFLDINRYKIRTGFVLHDGRLQRVILGLCRRRECWGGAGLDLWDGRRDDFRGGDERCFRSASWELWVLPYVRTPCTLLNLGMIGLVDEGTTYTSPLQLQL